MLQNRLRSVIFDYINAKYAMPHKIALVAIENCLSSAITGSIDLFTAANMIARLRNQAKHPIFEWIVVSEDGEPVKTFSGYQQEVDQSWDTLGEIDLIVIPGIALGDVDLLMDVIFANRSLIDWLKMQAKKETLIAGNCSGNFFMAEADLLNGHPATTTWWITDFLSERYPEILVQPDAILTASDQFICSGTAMSCLDMGIYLIERLAGQSMAKLTARYMLVDVNRNSQAPYRLPVPQNQQDRFILKARRTVRRNLHNDISVKGLAEKMNVSSRTLIRKFTQQTGQTPLAFIQNQRIEAGKELLEDSDLPLDEIVSRIGYQDSSSFRRLFKRETGLSPREYRKQFTINPVS